MTFLYEFTSYLCIVWRKSPPCVCFPCHAVTLTLKLAHLAHTAQLLHSTPPLVSVNRKCRLYPQQIEASFFRIGNHWQLLPNNICSYKYQLPQGQPNHTCGAADRWADIGSSREVFCPGGSYCPTTVEKVQCSSGYWLLSYILEVS